MEFRKWRGSFLFVFYRVTLLMSRSVSKGDPILVPILAINRSKELWGEDSKEFMYVLYIHWPDFNEVIPF
jgi:hypothetical protein